ncbi:MAG: pilus assembly protein PilM [Candidatus Margulisiibacteriota bacterium]
MVPKSPSITLGSIRTLIQRFFPEKPVVRVGVGIDITPTSIFVTVLRHEKGAYQLISAFEEPTPPDIFVKSKFVGPPALANKLKNLLHTHPIREKKLAIAIRGEGTLIKIVWGKPMSDLKTEKWLQDLASKYVVFSGSEIQATWQVASDEIIAGEPQRRLLAAFAKHDLIQTYEKSLLAAGIIGRYMVPPAIAILRASQDATQDTNFSATRMLMVVEAHQTTLLIVDSNIPAYVHTATIGADLLNNSPNTIDQLRLEIQQIVTQFQDKKPVEKIRLFSDDIALGKTLIEQLKSLNLPIEELRCNATGLSQDVQDKIPPGGMVSVGLALADPFEINFSKWDIRQQESRRFLIYLALSLIGSSLLMLVIFFGLYFTGAAINRQISHVRHEINDSSQQFNQVLDIEKELTISKIYIVGRRKLITGNSEFVWPAILKEIPAYMTGRIRITQMDARENQFIILKGEARSSDDVFQFLRQLKASPYYEAADLQEVVHGPQSGLPRFEIRLRQKGRRP